MLASCSCSPQYADAYLQLGPPRTDFNAGVGTSLVSGSDQYGAFYNSLRGSLQSNHHLRRSSASRRAAGSFASEPGSSVSIAAVQPFPFWPPVVPAGAVPPVDDGEMTLVADETLPGVDAQAFAEVGLGLLANAAALHFCSGRWIQPFRRWFSRSERCA